MTLSLFRHLPRTRGGLLACLSHLSKTLSTTSYSSNSASSNNSGFEYSQPQSLTYKKSDFVSFDPANIRQEPEEEREAFQDFLDTYGEFRFARPAPEYPDRDFVVSKDPEEWAHVENLISAPLIPPIPKKDSYPSGFVPPVAKPGDYPYHVSRTPSHMLPVYIRYNRRTSVLATVVRRADGNLFALRDDLKQFLFERYRMDFISQVAEVFGTVKFRGDFESDFKDFLLAKGF